MIYDNELWYSSDIVILSVTFILIYMISFNSYKK